MKKLLGHRFRADWGTARLRRAAVVLVASTMILTACSNSGDKADEKESEKAGDFHVVLVVPRTGPLAVQTEAMEHAWSASADAVNASGGINGRQVKLEFLDNAGDPTKAVSVLQKRLSSGPKPDVVMPGGSSNEALAMVPILVQNKILAFGANITPDLNNPEKYPSYFSAYPTTASVAASAAKNLQDAGFQKVALITSAEAMGDSVRQATEDAIKEAGMEVTGSETYKLDALDVTSQLQRLRDTKPDVLFVQAYGAPAGYVVNGLDKIGWDVPVVGDPSVAASNLPGLVDESQLKNIQFLVFQVQKRIPESEQSEAFKTMLNGIKGYGDIKLSLQVYTLLYDVLQVIQTAANQAGTTEHDALVKALENLEQPAEPTWVTYSTYVYDDTNHMANPDTSGFSLVPAGPTVDGMIGD